jgi:ubiquinone/menaquinone biosynthesis C-methylase UbiE
MNEEQNKKVLTSDYVKESYNSFLSNYGDKYAYYRWGRTPVSRYHFTQSRRALVSVLGTQKYGNSFEVGGGDGVWTRYIIDRSDSLTFLDISKEMISRAKENLEKWSKKITYIEGDFLDNKLEDEIFDLVLSFRNFEYFSDKEKGAKEFARILKPGGKLILVTKSPEYDWYGYFRGKTLHSGQISIKRLCELIQSSGFEVERVLPAIIGKKIAWSPLRPIYNVIHIILLKMPKSVMPLYILKYFSESFLIYAVKK